MHLPVSKRTFRFPKQRVLRIVLFGTLLAVSAFVLNERAREQQRIVTLEVEKSALSGEIGRLTVELASLKSQDQFVINKNLTEEIQNIHTTYKNAMSNYEELLKVKELSTKTGKIDELFTDALTFLSNRQYASASATLAAMTSEMQKLRDTLAASFSIPANVPASNAPPGSGYQRQQVNADIGMYLVDIISADLGSTRVIVDTASDSDCRNDCPVLSLADYVSRSGAFAGVNGSYFCPATYPSCADKKNSFDTLLMNKNKVYFNSDNNVYSTVPAVIFGGGWIRFVGQSLDWGRDTGVDGVIANQPLLLSGGNIAFGGNDDPKQGSKGSRSFVGNKGNTVYIGVAYNVTVAEMAHVLKTLGLENALNLDSGGSTALWSGGYKVGPGRNIPNAILFVRK